MMMTLPQAIISGAVQGITEFFPISSSGHLVILHRLFRIEEPQLAFDIFLHLGTLISILIFFRYEIIALFGKDRRLIVPIIIASIPTALIGYHFGDAIERFFVMPKIVGGMLVVTASWLMAASFYSRPPAEGDDQKAPGLVSSLLIGIAQGIAIVPGISRSGSTIATGMLTGLNREEAFRFSFLLAIPAVGGACLLKAHKIYSSIVPSDAPQFAAGAIAAMFVGILAIKVLMNVVKGNRLYIFGIYCFIVGVLTIILL